MFFKNLLSPLLYLVDNHTFMGSHPLPNEARGFCFCYPLSPSTLGTEPQSSLLDASIAGLRESSTCPPLWRQAPIPLGRQFAHPLTTSAGQVPVLPLIERDHGSAARLGGSPQGALRLYLLVEDQRWCPWSAEVRGTAKSQLPLVIVLFYEVWALCPTWPCFTRSWLELIFQVKFHQAVSNAFLKSKYITSTAFPSSANFVIPSKMQSGLSGEVCSL